MNWSILLFGGFFLAAIPLAFFFFLLRAKEFWPVTFLTFLGTAMVAMNYRIAANFSNLAEPQRLIFGQNEGQVLRFLAWPLCLILLFVGIPKILNIRATKAREALFHEEEKESS